MRAICLSTLALWLVVTPCLAEEPETATEPVPIETPEPEVTETTKPKDTFIRRLGKGFSLHKQNYVIPLTWSNVARHSEDAEFKFQFSFKQRLWKSFYFAYTQKSFWRILDQEDSRPFRETNHNPELFYRLKPERNRLGPWGLDVGYEHESNGAREPDSRSWDRVYIAPFFDFGDLRASFKVWYRLSEEQKRFPDDPEGDENPDIEDFYGNTELRLAYEFPFGHEINLATRWNFETSKGGLQFDYSIPTPNRNVFFIAQIWTGYGESLIDYNHYRTRYGIGLMFSR